MELKLHGKGIEAPPEKTHEAINSINFVKVKTDKKDYYIKTKGTG